MPKRLAWERVLVLLGTVVASIFFWETRALLPFKLLAVMGHETGHAVAALLVGGSVDAVGLSLDEGGHCLSRTPEGFFARTIVYSAGYVGSAVVATVLLVLTFRFRARRVMLGLACAWLTLMGLLYARDAFTLAFCLGMAALFAAGTKWLPESAVGALNLFIASFTALYAVMDLKDDLWNRAVRASSDAQLLADLTVLPAVAWAALWTLVSVFIVGLGGWLALHEDDVERRASQRGRSR